jgi:hypothetical protein
MSRHDHDSRFAEQWEEAAWDDATVELTSTLDREPTDQEIEARVAELWDQAEEMRAEADADRWAEAREARYEAAWDRWVDSM